MTRKSAMLLTDGREVYQSFGGNFLLKTGVLRNALEHLVYREADEIVLCMGSPNTFRYLFWEELFHTLNYQHFGAPITLIGGFKSRHIEKFIDRGLIERIGINSSIFFEDPEIDKLRNNFGNQFLIAHIPVRIKDNQLLAINFSSNQYVSLTSNMIDYLHTFDEISVHDIGSHGGTVDHRCCSLVNEYFDCQKIIYSGGINSRKDITSVTGYSFSAILVDNSILYSECRL